MYTNTTRLALATLVTTILLSSFATVSAQSNVQFVQQPQSLNPANSPFMYVPYSDFSSYGVQVTYKVQGVFPSDSVLNKLKACETTVLKAYVVLPEQQRGQLQNLRFIWSSGTDRGLGGGGSIYLKCNELKDAELTSVFVHEMGHVVDTGVYEGHSAAGMSAYIDSRTNVFKDDPSVAFYSISWKDTKHVWKGSTGFDFVTGYALSNPFEDFAESYNFYLLHGSQFKFMTKTNVKLAKKYTYLRDTVFGGREFVNNSLKLNAKKRSYDSTVLPFSLDTFLNNA